MFLPAWGFYMRISHTKNTAPSPEDLPAMLLVGDCDMFSNVRQLVFIGGTSPMGLGKQKWRVSALRHTKSHMRASMGQNRLAGLTMVAVHFCHARQVNTQANPAELQADPLVLPVSHI